MAKTITFKNGADLDRIDALLSGTRIRNRMPEAIRGNRSKMTLWAIEYLTKLVDGGVDNLQSELFTNNSEEWEVVTHENDQLKADLKKAHELENGYIKDINRMSKVITEFMRATNRMYIRMKKNPTYSIQHILDFINETKPLAENMQ